MSGFPRYRTLANAGLNPKGIVPANLGDLATMITSAMAILDRTTAAQAKPA